MERLKKYLVNWSLAEQALYWIVLLVVIFLPLAFWDFSDYHERRRIVWGWLRLLPFILIFLIHNFILLPYFLHRNRKTSYLLLTLLLILVLTLLFTFYPPLHQFLYEQLMGGASGGRVHGMGAARGGPGPGPGRGWHARQWAGREALIFVNIFLIATLVVAFNASLNFTTRWLKREQEQKDISREQTLSQLTALQQQVSPHFFMNTLNNIHALIDYDQAGAKESIIRLSELMRYLLYDSEKGITSLDNEIRFLNSYIDLMRLRLTDEVSLDFRFPETEQSVPVPPFLFLPFVENAFKHGIRATGRSFIRAGIELMPDAVHFNCVNSKAATAAGESSRRGLGIANTRKRLDLLFGSRYSLHIFDRKEEFEVDLIFPLVDQEPIPEL